MSEISNIHNKYVILNRLTRIMCRDLYKLEALLLVMWDASFEQDAVHSELCVEERHVSIHLKVSETAIINPETLWITAHER